MFELFLNAVLQILLVGLLVGAGLPALFSLGIKAMAYGAGGDAEISHEAGHPVGTVVGYLCFVLVLVAIAMGISIVVSSGLGYKVSFQHVFPNFTKK
ncbi:hypothetical protein EDD41_2826 [Luteococcus japonicus]|uniref:Uncharacterized protein n=2 Tax=Luteococcus japonicus TaxID=33984 RepID=A0A1R4KMN0_9ACTN|nr:MULTISPECIES: hypothetical protein [Luteococcus]MDN5563249.1 hypothetical protein [Luteococcus sp.]ROR55549.1 hypothetical protein EDD41_2826 [Luteococcus japonicus]SJN45626.1 hypothetical protein FM114_16180 [Luteococcus japonicus LSP_Lj1]